MRGRRPNPIAKPDTRPLRRIVGPDEVQAWLGIHKNTFNRWVKQGVFPQPFLIGEGAKMRRWFEDEILAAIQKQRAGATGKTA